MTLTKALTKLSLASMVCGGLSLAAADAPPEGSVGSFICSHSNSLPDVQQWLNSYCDNEKPFQMSTYRYGWTGYIHVCCIHGGSR